MFPFLIGLYKILGYLRSARPRAVVLLAIKIKKALDTSNSPLRKTVGTCPPESKPTLLLRIGKYALQPCLLLVPNC